MTDSDDRARGAFPPADLMTLSATRVGSAAVVTVTGELDLHTARELMAVVDDAMGWPGLTGVVIDLSGVDFLGSSGLGTLAELASRTTTTPGPGAYPMQPENDRPALRLVAPEDNTAVIRPWQTMNLQQILPLHPDVAAAIADI